MKASLGSHSRWAVCMAALLPLSACVLEEADVAEDAAVTFPAWTTAASQTAEVDVAAPEGWAIEQVEYSVDGGPWMQAPPGAAVGKYVVALSELDIGDNLLAVRVTSSYRGQSQIDTYYTTIAGVAPVFDCSSASSMLPDNTLIQQQNNETRTMVGYFGDPEGGHTVAFVLSFTNGAGDSYESVGTVISAGYTSMLVEFNVDQGFCDNNPDNTNNNVDCDTPYGLSLIVDGEEVCSSANFGNIHDYAGGGF